MRTDGGEGAVDGDGLVVDAEPVPLRICRRAGPRCQSRSKEAGYGTDRGRRRGAPGGPGPPRAPHPRPRRAIAQNTCLPNRNKSQTYHVPGRERELLDLRKVVVAIPPTVSHPASAPT